MKKKACVAHHHNAFGREVFLHTQNDTSQEKTPAKRTSDSERERPPLSAFAGGPEAITKFPVSKDLTCECSRLTILCMDRMHKPHHLETMVETILCWYLQGNHLSRVSEVVGNGFRPSTVGRLPASKRIVSPDLSFLLPELLEERSGKTNTLCL